MSADGEQGGVTQADRDSLTDCEQMQDAQKGCVPCALCGGHAVITDAGLGAGYYVQCSNSKSYKKSTGCLIDQRRLGGWAYNIMHWWNRLHTYAPATDTPDVVRMRVALERIRDESAKGKDREAAMLHIANIRNTARTALAKHPTSPEDAA